MVAAFYHHFRNNYPIAFMALVSVLFGGALIVVALFTTYNTALLDTLGFRTASIRLHAAKEAVFWTYRAWRHEATTVDLDPPRLYGFIQSVNRDTTVNITIIKDNQYQSERIALADVVVTNASRLAALVDAHKHDNMEFAFYPTNSTYPYTVVWFNGEPFNLMLITEGIATPDTTPPTNIVDRLFAVYYWKQFTR